MILQQPFKHAFQQQFNTYTMDLITNQLEVEQKVKVDFKMLTLKLKLCSWLYLAWLYIFSIYEVHRNQGMEEIDSNVPLTQIFKNQMINNIKTPLFKQIQGNITIETNLNCGEEETNAKYALEEVMIESLTRLEEHSFTNAPPSFASLYDIARKSNSPQV